jgi:hypothetical protein
MINLFEYKIASLTSLPSYVAEMCIVFYCFARLLYVDLL